MSVGRVGDCQGRQRSERMERRKRRRSASRIRKGGRKDERENRLDREREKVVSERMCV